MSLSQSFFPSETDEILHPQFTRTLKGFSVAEVDSYVAQTGRRIEVLEAHLDKALTERDHLRHELASVKANVYRSAGERLAGILRNIDEHVEGVRRQAEEDAARRVAAAQGQADTLKGEAEEALARTRAEAARVLQDAHEEAGRVLGTLTDRRDAVQGEIESLRGVLLSLLERLDAHSDDAEPAAVSSEGEDGTVTDQADDDGELVGAVAEEGAEDAEDDDSDADDEWAVQVDTEVVDLRDISIEDGLGNS